MAFKLPLDPPAANNAVDRRLRLVFGRGGAEAATVATSFGALHYAEKLTPEKLKGLKAFTAKHIIAPHLEMFDKMADKMPGFEGPEGIKERKAMTPEQRAEYYANGIVDYSILVSGSLAGQMVAQTLLDHMMGLKLTGTGGEKFRKMALATTADRGLQIGTTLLLTAGMPQLTEKAQHAIAKHVLNRVGITDEKEAEEKARAFVTLNMPNWVGWAGSVGFLDRVYAKELAVLEKTHGK